MSYADALNFLGQCRRFGVKLGLEPMEALAGGLGHPEEQLRFIHLAGTNGKGSTAAFCESCLRVAGHRTGLYTSPHLVSVRERIQVDGVPISETAFAAGIEAVRLAMDVSDVAEATFFEVMTALALWHFAREEVDWVVWETGLGGRLDATNIVRPAICIITNIGLEHQQFLGQTLSEIAAEKAGILKAGVPVVSAVEPGEASEVIVRRARELRCTLTLVSRDRQVEELGLSGVQQRARIDGDEFVLGLVGSHQVRNAACAVEAMRQLRVELEAIKRGLESTVWPGRFEIVSERPLIVLDGAHNPAGTQVLVETWRAFLSSRFGWHGEDANARTHLVFAAAVDKDITEMAALLRPLAREVSLVRLANERGADPQQLASAFSGLPCSFHDSVATAWAEVATGPGSGIVLVTGSLFLIGEVLARQRGSSEEYRLNERLENIAPAR